VRILCDKCDYIVINVGTLLNILIIDGVLYQRTHSDVYVNELILLHFYILCNYISICVFIYTLFVLKCFVLGYFTNVSSITLSFSEKCFTERFWCLHHDTFYFNINKYCSRLIMLIVIQTLCGISF